MVTPTGKVWLKDKPYSYATCKEELTTGQYQKIISEWGINLPEEERNNLKLFNILTGADFNAVNLSLEDETAIFECISWCFGESFQYDKECPKVLEIEGEIMELPERVGACSIGQNVILKQILDSCTYLEEGIALATAIYLQPVWSKKKFDYKKAKKLEELIKQMPATLIYPIGFFLLQRAYNAGKKPTSKWQQIKNSLNTLLKEILPSWLRLKSSGNTSDLIRLTGTHRHFD